MEYYATRNSLQNLWIVPDFQKKLVVRLVWMKMMKIEKVEGEKGKSEKKKKITKKNWVKNDDENRWRWEK